MSPSSAITIGASVTDQAILAGGYPSTGVTGIVTYAFFAGGACAGIPSSVSTVTVGAGDSVPNSGSVTPPSAGSFAFNATYGGDTNNTRVSSTCEPLTVLKTSPSITTVVTPSTIVVGGSVSDQATLTGGFPSTGVTGGVTYAFFSNSACTGTPISSSSVTISAGDSVPASSSVTPPAAGSFAFNATYSGDPNNNRVSSLCEPLSVNKATPSITTAINPSSTITVGFSVADQATVTGGFPSAGVTGSVVYAFFSNGGCTGAPTSTSTFTVGPANSVAASASVTPSSAGSFAFNATYGGDANDNRVSSSCEPLTVNKQSPSIATAISPSPTATVGSSVTDQATLTAGFPSTGVTGSVTYAFFSNGACTGNPTSTSTVAVGAANTVPASASVTPVSAGSFSLNATYAGDSNNNRVSSSCEPLTVNKQTPTATTSVSPSSTITVGASVTDQASLTGGFPSTGVTGIVTYAFFNNAACTGNPISSSTVTVGAGNSVPASSSLTPPSAGSFAFNATYSGDTNNNRVSSACEPLAVTKQTPSITTAINLSSTVTVGASVTDQATLTGGYPSTGVTGSVTYAFFSNGACAGTPTSISTLTVGAGNSVPTSTSVTPTSAGNFAFNATYGGDVSNNRVSSSCELLTVTKQTPSLATSISPSSNIVVGTIVTDQATLTGGFPSTGVTGTVSYYFFTDGSCTDTPASEGTVTIGASNSVAASNSVTPSPAGSYSFNATYSGDNNNNKVSSPCETMTVNKQTPTLATTINPSSSIVVGSSVTDQATITGGFPSTGVSGTMTYHFFGLGDGVCSGAPVSSQTVSVGAGNSMPPSGSQTPGSPGQYSFNATYNGDANNNLVTSSCELLTVNPISTTTGIFCGPSITVGVPTTCTVTVSDTAPGTLSPGGTVSWSTNSTTGLFSPTSSCTLSGTGTSATCSVTYTPSLGPQNITATYPGDPTHRGSAGSLVLVPGQHSTTTSVSCSSPVVVNQASTCTATATDTSTVATTPTGSVTFTLASGVSGNFNSTSCTLRSSTSSTANCGVMFTPSASGTAGANINAAYAGDSTHSPSAGATNIAVNPRATSTTVSCTSPVVVNQASACTATVADTSASGTPITPIGTVTFTSTGVAGGFTSSPCTLSGSGSSATCTATFLDSTASGSAAVSAFYASSGSVHGNSTSTVSASITVSLRTTTLTVACNNPIVIGQASTCTATVTDSSAAGNRITPSGTVTFSQSVGSFTGSPCTLVASSAIGVATCTADFTSPTSGSVTINGSYVPSASDTSHSGSQTTSSATIVVNRRSTNTTVSCLSVNVGQTTSCTATVTDSSPGSASTPGGVVTFTASGGSVTPVSGSCALTSGSCSVSFTPQSFGLVTVNATYIGGDSVHAGSSGITSFTPGVQGTSATISCSTPIIVNQGSTCTATVVSTAASGPTVPSGTVTFSSGSSVTPTTTSCSLNGSGNCSVTLTGSVVGTANIVGNYTGDNAHTSSKNTATITVNPRASSTTRTCATTSLAVNSSDTCTVYVKDTSMSTAVVPVGSVSLELDGSTSAFATCALSSFNSTTASCTANYMPAPGTQGPHTLTANYLGDVAHSGSSSKALAVNVTQRTTSTTVNCAPSTVAIGQSTTCTATVKDTSSGNPITPNGLVSFSVSPTGSGSFTGICTLSQSVVGTATCNITYAPSATGSQTISGSYNGDTDHSSGVSGIFTLTVSVQTTASFINCISSSIVVGTTDSCTATIKDLQSGSGSTAPSGSVSFSLDSPSSIFATCSLGSVNSTAGSCNGTYTPALGTEGSHSIIATYTPDTSHGASSSSVSVLVIQRTTTPIIACNSNTVPVGSNNPCTATI